MKSIELTNEVFRQISGKNPNMTVAQLFDELSSSSDNPESISEDDDVHELALYKSVTSNMKDPLILVRCSEDGCRAMKLSNSYVSGCTFCLSIKKCPTCSLLWCDLHIFSEHPKGCTPKK